MDAPGESETKQCLHAYPTVITKILRSIISSYQVHRLACQHYVQALNISRNGATPECIHWIWAYCAPGNTSPIEVLTCRLHLNVNNYIYLSRFYFKQCDEM